PSTRIGPRPDTVWPPRHCWSHRSFSRSAMQEQALRATPAWPAATRDSGRAAKQLPKIRSFTTENTEVTESRRLIRKIFRQFLSASFSVFSARSVVSLPRLFVTVQASGARKGGYSTGSACAARTAKTATKQSIGHSSLHTRILSTSSDQAIVRTP